MRHSSATRVMVAEYLWSDRTTVADFLRLVGFEVHEADNGRTALDLSRIIRPELILIAKDLPVLTGLDVAVKVRHDYKLAAVPVIMMIDEDSEATVAAALDAGCSDVIVKPIGPDDLVSRIDRVLAAAHAA